MSRGQGRVVALDPGSVRIGVAVCDSTRSLAFPRQSIAAGDGAVELCIAVVREEEAGLVVVGHPLQLDGTAGRAAEQAASLAASLRAALHDDGIDVVLHDERLTTVTAVGRLREAGVDARGSRGHIDGEAAVVLLESWMAT